MQKLLRQAKCSLLILSDKDSSHRWLLKGIVSSSLVIVPARGKPTLLMSPLEHFSNSSWNIIAPKTRDEQKKAIDNLLKGVRVIAVSGSTCSLRMQKMLGNKRKLIDVEEKLLELRAIKSGEEIDSLRRANALTAQCFNQMMDVWQTFSHERDVILFIKQFALDHDAGLSFDSIVASGANAAVPHHATPTKINSGFCVLDFGFDVDGYKADMTRTIYIGKPSSDELLLYEKILEIQEAAVAMVKPGVKCADLHNFVVKSLGESDAKLFTHSLGHGVGIDIHELPNVSSKSSAVLSAGMTITIEPGIYDSKSRKKFGIRIEDSLIVTKNGCEVLTKGAKKGLVVVTSK